MQPQYFNRCNKINPVVGKGSDCLKILNKEFLLDGFSASRQSLRLTLCDGQDVALTQVINVIH